MNDLVGMTMDGVNKLTDVTKDVTSKMKDQTMSGMKQTVQLTGQFVPPNLGGIEKVRA